MTEPLARLRTAHALALEQIDRLAVFCRSMVTRLLGVVNTAAEQLRQTCRGRRILLVEDEPVNREVTYVPEALFETVLKWLARPTD